VDSTQILPSKSAVHPCGHGTGFHGLQDKCEGNFVTVLNHHAMKTYGEVDL